MSHFSRISLSAIALCFALASCSTESRVTLTEKNFAEEIENQQNLIFKFSHDLAPDSVLNVWDSTEYINIVPAVKGSFKWTSGNELVFSPSGEFQPSTTYKARITKKILRFSGNQLNIPTEEIISFRTPYLKVENSMAWWSTAVDAPGLVVLNISLDFNYMVNPLVISDLMKFKINGKDYDFKITSNTVSQTLQLNSSPLSRDMISGSKVEYTIKEGALCQSCINGTVTTITGIKEIKAPDKLEITHIEGVLQTGTGSIIVYCNQEVNTTGIESLIKISPNVKFSIEPQGNGFLINGNFEAGSSYQLDISKQLSGAIGGTLANDYTAMVPFGQMEPSIGFASNKGIYMSTRSSKKIAINIVNIPKVHVRIFKIYENNILSFMKYHRYNEYYDEGESNGYGFNDYEIGNMGDVIMDQDYDTKNLAKQNGVSLLSLDFEQKNQFQGIYFVTVSSTEDRWRKSSKMISISDIGIIARHTKDEVYVFANSIKDAKPLKGTRITFISTNNQVLNTAITDGNGVAVLKSVKNKFPGFNVGLITAREGNDFNYMSLEDSRVEDSRFDVGGKTANPSGYEAFIYGDREIYRPGEKVYINTIVRTEEMNALGNIPLKIKILMPNGREYTSIKKILNKEGAAESSFALSSSSVTGTWSMEAYTANNVLLASRNFSVEEFLPDRISVKSSVDKEVYKTGDSVLCKFTAMNLFGTPATLRNYQMDFSLTKKTISSKAYSKYNFSLSGASDISFNNILREGKTGNDGNVSEYFPISIGYNFTGLLNGKIFITVFDETGRPVNRVENFNVSTQPVYYGIRMSDYYNSARQPLKISLAATDAGGIPKSSSRARLQVIKVNWETVMERDYGSRYRYKSQRQEKILVDKMVNISSTGLDFSFTPEQSGQYLARIQDPGANTYVQSEFYAYGWGYTQNNSFEVNNEGEVEMEFDKEVYEVGDKAKILMKTPFAGRMLVTVERNKVFDYFYIDTDKRSASVVIPVKEEYLPNVYITATLFRPLDDGTIPVTIAHGFSNLPVAKKSNKLPLEIKVAQRSRSNSRQKITVQTIAKSDVEITVAVVDEGIMQLKNSLSPDPYNFFYQKRALEVNSFDIYPYVLPDLVNRYSTTGGDGYDLQKRINPMSNKRVKLVAYWSGILHTDGNGTATCSVDIPQFSGDLRVMAVAYKDRSFGSAESHIKVADPIIISPSIPRFLSPGDELTLPVTISNTTGSNKNVTVSLQDTGPLSITGNNELFVSIPAYGESRQIFKVSVAKQTGEGSLIVKVKNGTETFTDKTEITIRPPASLQKLSGAGEIAAGNTSQITMTNNFIESSRTANLVVSRSPLVQFSDQLSYLLEYPYGCVEQTISTAFPQLYYTSLAKAINNKHDGVVQVSTNVQAAISKLQSMQLYNGSMSYWPGTTEESWWGSVYGLHFLNEAKKAGYSVSQTTIDKLAVYISGKIKSHPVESYNYYNDAGTEIIKKIPSKDIFYSLYILALYHKADIASMNYYRSRLDELAIDSKYLLAASYLACGDRKTYQNILPAIFDGEKSIRSTGGNFYSYIRDEAVALNALLETDPTNSQIGSMVRHLSQQMKTEKYLSTQERAFAFLALGKYLKKLEGTKITAVIKSGERTLGNFNGDDLTLSKGIGSEKIDISTTGTGKLYYFWEMEGLTSDGTFKEEDSYLQVRKTFLNRFGQPITDLNKIRQNDLLVVKIVLKNLVRNKVENVVVADLLPAGFEIENPRISAVPELAWIKDNAIPDYMDIRDDRIHYFTNIEAAPKSFYYLVRAVSTGKFVMGPVSADAMYDGSYHSYNGAGKITIIE